MLSLQQTIEIRESIKSYLQATFTFRKKQVANAFENFIDQSMNKGPYISLKLRFVKADPTDIGKIPLTIKPTWPPYDHQVKSWTKLSTRHKKPEPTIVTTGTGSGKTESFLYPMLDYCYQQQHKPGIKVIILYPMNALATDQAKRLAEMIEEDERLKGKITAGLFIGEGNGAKGQFPKVMGANHIIEHRESILDSPPDILLTNFKMLDYALMKHNFHKLWVHNFPNPELLQFLVLDELHTYDGAQGTDVANLIRRLKLKLKLPTGHLCPVGTSATIGSGSEAPALLAEYATKIFGENITTNAIITENRISSDLFFAEEETLNDFIPLPNKLKDLSYKENDGYENFIRQHIDIWQQDKSSLSEGLIQLKIVKDLVVVINKGAGIKTLEELMRDLSIVNDSYRKLPQWDDQHQYSPKERVLESLFSLISEAKDIDNPRSPFMYLQIQLWIRELSGVQYTLEQPATFSFRDQVDAQQEIAALPPWYCRECNSSGWLGVKLENSDAFTKDINEVYDKYFAHNKNVYFILPKDELSYEDIQVTGYQPDDFLKITINPITLKILKNEDEGFQIQAFRKLRENKLEEVCPCCNSMGSIAIVGTKIPTLSSIAVSQTLATDLDVANDQGRKILAFTNSVQDAAHQAGFIEGRNYRFALRASIQKVINQLGKPVSLSAFADEFIAYWKENGDESGQDSLNGYLYRFFPKDYIGKASPKDYLRGEQYSAHFLTEFDIRIRWEIYSEFGYNAKIGRTLEKTGASSVSFTSELLEQSWNEIEEWIAHNDVSGTIDKETFVRFSNLVLHRSRIRGAIDHEYLSKFRKEKQGIWELNWQNDSRHFLNQKFSPRTRFPKLLTNQQSRDNLLDTTKARTSNWFHTYFSKTFQMASSTLEFVNEFFEQWTQSLVNAGILNKEHTGDEYNFGINADAVWVHKNIKTFTCDTCEDTLHTYDDSEYVENGSCLSYRCSGNYHLSPQKTGNYYETVYNRNRSPRVFSREHTGLLERRVRENLEIDFKKRPKFNSVNTLIATSTLEMGIDIGDLNTAYNNSIPPLPSNFLQRVGRAGRSSGSAVIVNFAKNQNHDLYYFTDPLEMMHGTVNTPGCYLEAKDILKRHFTAFCFDSWASKNPNENTIPTFVRDLKLLGRDLISPEFFINRLCHFISDNELELTTSFLKQYDQNIEDHIFPEILQSLHSGIFYTGLSDVFVSIQKEILIIEKRKKEIDDEVKVLSLAKGDPLYDEYVKEKRNLNGIRKSIAGRNVLEHLTNVGILPNYAFPETGVTLNAHVLSNEVEASTNKNLDKDFEVVRPSSAAIKELAPENFFYTQGFRFEISGVNTFDWNDLNIKHKKRFCSKCDHLEIDSISKSGHCPKCGDPSWSSASNVHTFVKLTAVKSFNSASKATVTDANDDREKKQYQVIDHVLLKQETSAGAWILKDIPFGIEFVKSAKITSVNYGRKDINDARKIRINNEETLTKGFVTCKHCGKSISATHLITEVKDFHYGYCKNRNIKYEPGNSDVFEEVYFFREMQTEVLKIVLPIQEFNSDSDIRMFQAGLELGLKKYFKGNPGHIHIQAYREFNQLTDKFDRFLLMYDTIPGGTGYLEQLFDDQEFSLLLRLCYESIRDCSCQAEGHDGCYKCIYSYGNQYNRSDLSRSRAEKWFEKIYNQTEEWVKTNNGLTSLTNTGKIEESELEERFIKLLSIYADKEEGYTFLEKKNNGTVYYELKIEKGNVDALYWIRPQIVLGPKDGIAYNTRTDFLVTCGQFKYKEKEYRSEMPKIAVYLDGYQYHASEKKNSFENDIKIRQAIVANPEFKTWSLTWADLDYFQKQLQSENACQDDVAIYFKNNFSPNLTKLLQTIQGTEKVNFGEGTNNVDRFISQLVSPPSIMNKQSWYSFLGSWTASLLEPSFDPSSLHLLLNKQLTVDSYIKNNRISNFDALLPVQKEIVFSFAEWNIWINIGKNDIYNQFIYNSIDSIDKKEWEIFWQYFNLFQSDIFIETDFEAEITILQNEEWQKNVFAEYDDKYADIIQQAIDKGIITESNCEYLDSWIDEDTSHVLADGYLVFSSLKMVFNPFSEESRKIFEKAGFSVYSDADIKNIKL